MRIKPLLLTIIAGCGVLSGAAAPAEQPAKPPEEDVGDQHFCCFDVDVSPAGKGTGDGCTAIEKVNINTCDRVLFCDGAWLKKDGKVTCL